jgi:fatty acid desaturase
MNKESKELGTGKFLAIMGGVWFLMFAGKLLFAILVGCIAYFAFGSGFDTASFAAVMAYLIPSFLIGMFDLIPQKKKTRKKPL